jgi:regulator of protease activity HflC (stomatin/prohibitin superfamily)
VRRGAARLALEDLMNQSASDPGASGLGSSRANRFVARLCWVYGGFAGLVALLLSLAFIPSLPLSALHAQAAEAAAGGAGGLVLSTLLMALTALLATQALTAARQWYLVGEDDKGKGVRRFSFRRAGPGVAARQGQAVIVSLGAVLTCFASWLLWPMASSPLAARAEPNIIGAVVVAFAFCSLICERMMGAFPAPQMPEAPPLRRVLLMTTILLAAAGALEVARGAGFMWASRLFFVLPLVPWVVTIELALRALARLFLPPPRVTEAKAAVDSILLAMLTGGAFAPGALIRDHLGLDFTRSWALSYLVTAALPAVLATALLCWALSGLKLVDLSERGIYERFGAPVAVLGPGIHLLPPWPIGIMRPLEFGTLHEVKVGSSPAASAEPHIDAEAIPPASTNHLWDTADPAEAEYLVASQSGAAAQSFQSVDAEIHVVYRIGLTNADAMASVYGATDPEALVGEAAARVVSFYFASHTLESVMGARRDALAESLRAALARDISAYHAGVEIVSVHIESVHPPAGAAAAYHAVQAAEINANASVFNETGRAKRMAGVAQQEAHQLTTAAQASAEEKIQEANGEAYQFAADRKAYAEGATPFVTERSFASLVATLGKSQLTIVDNRISPAQSPIIDLRGGNGANLAAPAQGGPPPQAAQAPAVGANAPAAAPLTPGVEDAK